MQLNDVPTMRPSSCPSHHWMDALSGGTTVEAVPMELDCTPSQSDTLGTCQLPRHVCLLIFYNHQAQKGQLTEISVHQAGPLLRAISSYELLSAGRKHQERGLLLRECGKP